MTERRLPRLDYCKKKSPDGTALYHRSCHIGPASRVLEDDNRDTDLTTKQIDPEKPPWRDTSATPPSIPSGPAPIAENPHGQRLGWQRAGIGRIGGPAPERREIPAPPIADAAPPEPPISRPPPGVRPLCRRDRTTCDHVVAHQTTPRPGWDWTVAGGGWGRSKPEGFLCDF